MGLCLERHGDFVGKICTKTLHATHTRFQTGVVSDEDIAEIWETAKKETMEQVRGNKNRSARAESPMADEKEVGKSFWLTRPDGWVVNRKMKKIVP